MSSPPPLREGITRIPHAQDRSGGKVAAGNVKGLQDLEAGARDIDVTDAATLVPTHKKKLRTDRILRCFVGFLLASAIVTTISVFFITMFMVSDMDYGSQTLDYYSDKYETEDFTGTWR
jgi:hypothetical protein